MTAGHTTSEISLEAVIRFPQVDPAGIVFYPRYFEMVGRYFPDLRLDRTPLGIKTQFLKPNRFGDRITLTLRRGERWSVTGRMDGGDCFAMNEMAMDSEQLPQSAAYRTETETVSHWCAGDGARLQLSRYFELLNMAIEEWFEQSLDVPFAELHVEKRVGIPTVQFDTSVFERPVIGDEISIWLQPEKIGKRSMTFTSWLVTGERCQIRNRQVIVFVRMLPGGYESIDVPDSIRAAFEQQLILDEAS